MFSFHTKNIYLADLLDDFTTSTAICFPAWTTGVPTGNTAFDCWSECRAWG